MATFQRRLETWLALHLPHAVQQFEIILGHASRGVRCVRALLARTYKPPQRQLRGVRPDRRARFQGWPTLEGQKYKKRNRGVAHAATPATKGEATFSWAWSA